MKYQILKRVTKDYEEVFTKERKIEEIHISIKDVDITITEQQLGNKFNEAEIIIDLPNNYTYVMDWSTFIKKITQ